MRPFGKAEREAMRAYVQSRQYHTMVESRVIELKKKKKLEEKRGALDFEKEWWARVG